MNEIDTEICELSEFLRGKFDVFKTSNLHGIKAEEFELYLNSKIGSVDPESEDFSPAELEKQRDLSVKFHWGHNHDFGAFKLDGRMGDRHINLLARFLALFPVALDDFSGKYVLDVGCWTGGTTLLLSTIADKVLAIEEVKKYADMVSYMAQSFEVSNQVEVKPLSIYECSSEEFDGKFDIVYFPGVLYHLSDPVLALRILFNSLKIGGHILVESAGVDSNEPICRFEGNSLHHSGDKASLSRGGWNWFLPSPSALHLMMVEAGFDEVQTIWDDEVKRVFGYGKKTSQVGMCKAGLSVPKIK